MRAEGAVHLTLKQTVKSVFLVDAHVLVQALNEDTAAGIVSDLEVLVLLHHVSGGLVAGKKVSDAFIVDFSVTDANSDCLVKASRAQGVKLGDRAGNDAAVLEDRSAASHAVGLACSGLAVAKDGSVVTFDDGLNNLAGRCFVGFVLRSVVEDLLKRELPGVSFIINVAILRIFVGTQVDCALKRVDLDVLAREVSSGPRSDDDLDSLFNHFQIITQRSQLLL